MLEAMVRICSRVGREKQHWRVRRLPTVTWRSFFFSLFLSLSVDRRKERITYHEQQKILLLTSIDVREVRFVFRLVQRKLFSRYDTIRYDKQGEREATTTKRSWKITASDRLDSCQKMPSTTTTTTTSMSANPSSSSSKENIIDLCTTVGEVFSKFGVLLRDLEISNRRSISNNDQEQNLIGWDEQSVTMFRQAVQTFAISVRDISTVVAEKRLRER